MVPLLALCLVGFAPPADDAPMVPLPDGDWPAIRQSREAALNRHLETASGGYAWFAHALHGEGAGTPLLLLRAFPDLAPDLWGPPEERFARFGFLDDPSDPGRPLPLGFGWVLDPVQGDSIARDYHSASLTCAACHVGRVQDAPGHFKLLIGAPNTQIDVRKFRRAVELSVDRLLGTDAGTQQTARRLVEIIDAKPPGYFFGNRYGIDAEAEARERKKFHDDPAFVAQLLGGFARRVRGGRAAVVKQLQTSYSLDDAPPLDGGSPGQSDGSGDLIPKFLLFQELTSGAPGDPVARLLATDYPALPSRNASVTDNLSVWMQQDRPYGQIDGSLKEPIFRNVAAQTAVVGSPLGVNLRNADIAARFTARLPAPPYPFAVDMLRARRGEALFRDHCLACHRAGNTNVYPVGLIGTDPNRARVLSKEGQALLVDNFVKAFVLTDKDYVATRADGTQFKPAELKLDEIINDRVRPENQGYVAGPLSGIWARAPYLHNGSVPTLRHLLAPGNPESHRPASFLRGQVGYDTRNVGFEWDGDAAPMADGSPTAVIFDTRWDAASNRGHDGVVGVDDLGGLAGPGRGRRLDWSGPGRRSDLEDLLEYLKTL
ncbi:hypothetical protein TA3x_001563 [Tundrisphaera sp. TA3]|uniref:c-type cytochrome n=1 Tax=Tundrisphaera sp. TA3 TaxID=3435775 RepID=UPI003EC0DF01